MTDAEYDAVSTEAFRLIDEVAIPNVAGNEDTLESLKRLAGLDREVTLMIIVRGLEAAKGLIDETTEVCAYFMLLGAILSTDYQRRQRVISIEKAKRALPDYVQSGAQGEATSDPTATSKDGQ